MTLSSTISRVSYSTNGVTTAFSFPYYFLKNADLVVIIKNNATGVETLQVLTTDYTVSGAGIQAGGTVTMNSAPLTAQKITIFRAPSPIQETDLVENDELPAETLEKSLDLSEMVNQRNSDRIDRTVRLSDGDTSGFNPTFPQDFAVNGGNKIPVVKSDLSGFEDAANWLDATTTSTSSVDAAASAAAAAASASASATSATNSSNSATASAASASASANSATAAQTAVNSAFWRDVLFLTFADSPLSIVDATHRGKLLCFDTSGGNIVVNLPQISTLNLTTAFTLGVKKTSGDGNSITVNRASSDLIDGATTKVITAADAGAVFIPDTDPTPDEWTTTEFGASAGSLTTDLFSGDNTTTAFTLAVDPGSENNTFVFISGVYQQKDTYSVTGTTLTFSVAPPTGSNNIQVVSGTTLSIGVPGDASVSPVKLTGSSIPHKGLVNYSFTVAMAANAVTIALKDDAGNDPSSTSPVRIEFRDPTLTSGLSSIVDIVGALSTVISSGSKGGSVDGVLSRIFIYLINNAGSVELAWSGSNVFPESGVVSTTAEGGAGGADAGNVMYSTTARTNVAFRYIGFFESTQSTAGTWAASATKLSKMTNPSLGGANFAESASCGVFTDISGAFADVTNLFVTITTTGRPVVLKLVADGDATVGNHARVEVAVSVGNTAEGVIAFLEGSTIISQQNTGESDTGPTTTDQSVPSSSFNHEYTPPAGTYTYKVQAKIATGTGISVLYTKLRAREV